MKFITLASPIYPAIQLNRTQTHDMSSRAGSFMFVMGKERADFAAVSALSLVDIDMTGYPT